MLSQSKHVSEFSLEERILFSVEVGVLTLFWCLPRSGKQRWITAMFPSDPLEDMEQASENIGKQSFRSRFKKVQNF